MVINKNSVLWKGQSGVSPNIWGLAREGKKLGFSLITGPGYNDAPGPLATIFWALFMMPILIGVTFSISPLIGYLCIIMYLSLIHI